MPTKKDGKKAAGVLYFRKSKYSIKEGEKKTVTEGRMNRT